MTTKKTLKCRFLLASTLSMVLTYAGFPATSFAEEVQPTSNSNATALPAATAGTPATAPATSGPASTTAPPSKDANQSVPDWLKDYDKPPSPSAPSSGSSSSVDIHRSTSPVTTSLGTMNTGVAPGRPAPRATETPAPKTPTRMLQGRLEEVGGVGARLPVGLSLKSLKAEAGKLDKSVIQANVQKQQANLPGAIASFPMDWRGAWSGPLKIHDSQLDPIEWQFDPTEAKGFQEILVRGTQVNGSFSFTQTGNKVEAEPGVLVFPMRKASSADIDQAMSSAGLGALLGGANGEMMKSMLSGMNLSQPRMYLGDLGKTRGVGGNEVSSRVLRNSVRQLKEGVIEEDIIAREQDRSVNTGKTIQKISETVIRFTRLNPSQLYVQGAAITYRDDGHFLNKILFYGTINRGASSGDSMMGLPGMGSFPGLGAPGAGGAGGMDAINQMMKQLQGM